MNELNSLWAWEVNTCHPRQLWVNAFLLYLSVLRIKKYPLSKGATIGGRFEHMQAG